MTTYGLAMIVKDEAPRVRRCLDSLRPHVGWWTIADTGSTDGTQDIIREVMTGIPGELLERPWVNFGVNRTQVFASIQGRCDWYFATDADMAWTVDPGWTPDPAIDAYMVEMGGDDFGYRLPLVLRGDLPWRSVGACHEYTTRDGGYAPCPADAVRIEMGSAAVGSVAKSRWHAGLLEADLAREPDNARTVFYLAQTYRDLGSPRAREMYERRAEMGGSPGEAYYAAYWAAVLTPEWPDRAAAYLAAWESRPTRLEALHALIRELNSRDLHHAAYRLCVDAGPAPDDLFVHRWIWDYGMDFERSIAAWWTGHGDEARRLFRRLLKNPRLPESTRAQVIANMACGAPA